MTFPIPLYDVHFAGILMFLGWDVEYSLDEVKTKVREYLDAQNMEESDRRLIHTSFIHTSIDHSDLMMAYYGCKTKLVVGEDRIITKMSFSPYTP